MKHILSVFIFHSLFSFNVSAEIDSSHWNSQKPQTGNYLAVFPVLTQCCSANLRPDGYMVLEEVASILRQFPEWSFCVEVHSDCRASSEYNLEKTQAMADSIKNWMQFFGIAENKIQAIGLGESEPLNPRCRCDLTDPGNRICSEKEHQENRKVLFRLDRYIPPDYFSFKINHQTAETGQKQYFCIPFYHPLRRSFSNPGVFKEIKQILTANADFNFELTYFESGAQRKLIKEHLADSQRIKEELQKLDEELPYPDMLSFRVEKNKHDTWREFPYGMMVLEIKGSAIRSINWQNPKVGQYTELLYYASSWNCINGDYHRICDSTSDLIKNMEGFTLRIEAYSDCRADEEYNLLLTRARADTIKSYLSTQGVDTAGILVAGYGENRRRLPKCRCRYTDSRNLICTEAEHQMNRKIIVRIVEM